MLALGLFNRQLEIQGTNAPSSVTYALVVVRVQLFECRGRGVQAMHALGLGLK